MFDEVRIELQEIKQQLANSVCCEKRAKQSLEFLFTELKEEWKQYENTIRQSLDGESPVFSEPSEESYDTEKRSISEMCRKQVVRLMTSVDDDGDYLTHPTLLENWYMITGPLEKYVSIQSDSSGFADLYPPGEIILSGETATIEFQLPKSAESTVLEDLFVCCRSDFFCSENEQIKPTLSSITYAKTEQELDEAVVLTLHVLIDTFSDNESSVSRASSSSRFVSEIDLRVEVSPEDKETADKSLVSRITCVNDVRYQKVNPDGDLENDLDLETEMSAINNGLSRSKDVTLKMSSKGHPRDINRNVPTYHLKDKMQEKIKSKENLIIASSNTAHWLLESNKCAEQTGASYCLGRPVWASTPNLRYKKSSSGDHWVKNRIKHERAGNWFTFIP
ncbi:hypothetical protein ACF0H5_015580 [Mactra antiquata]